MISAPDAVWVDAATFLVAISFAVISLIITKIQKTGAEVSVASFSLDMLRGASALPLALIAIGPLAPQISLAVAQSNPVLLALGAANGLLTIIADWWRST